MKNSKSKSVAARPTFAARLSASRGRIVGVSTLSSGRTRKFNGQVRSVTPSYVTMYDRNRKTQVKFALNSIVSVSGV